MAAALGAELKGFIFPLVAPRHWSDNAEAKTFYQKNSCPPTEQEV